MKVSRAVFETRKVAGHATYKHSKLNCVFLQDQLNKTRNKDLEMNAHQDSNKICLVRIIKAKN